MLNIYIGCIEQLLPFIISYKLLNFYNFDIFYYYKLFLLNFISLMTTN